MFRIGEDYYITKYVDKYLEFEDIFIDDFTNDAEITEPDRFDFAEEQIYGNVVIDYDAYHEAQAEYEAKYIRDEIREYFSENPEMATSQNLYKLDGTELIEISTGVYAEEYFQDRIIQKIVGYEKIKLSEVEDLNDAKMKAYDCTRYPKREYYMLKKDGTLILLEDYAVDPFRQGKISEDEKYIYCLEDYSAGSGTFIRYTLTESGLSERKVLYEDVEEVTKYGECTVVYLEDEIVGVLENDGYTELGENLGDRLIRKNDVLFYCDEISEINGVGNLNRYKDGKVSEIDIDVFEFIPRSEDVCYYIADYSSNSQIGELYRYKNGEKEKIDSDVSFIVY